MTEVGSARRLWLLWEICLGPNTLQKQERYKKKDEVIDILVRIIESEGDMHGEIPSQKF